MLIRAQLRGMDLCILNIWIQKIPNYDRNYFLGCLMGKSISIVLFKYREPMKLQIYSVYNVF